GYFEYNDPEPEKFADGKVKETYQAYQKMEKRYQNLDGTRIVLLGSSPYDETALIKDNNSLKNKNKAMQRIVDFQKQSAKDNHWEFLDFNSPITLLNQENQQKDPAFTLCGNDRVHPDNDGHMVMAYIFLQAQGFAGEKVAQVSIDAGKQKVNTSENCTISNLQKTNNGISFKYLAKALPYPLDTLARGWGSKKSQFDATQVVPFMQEMNQELFMVKGLDKGKYNLLIDDELIGNWSSEEIASGLNLAEFTNTPQYQQALRVMYLNEERWEIERRFRDYAWVQYNFFLPKGLLDANNRKAIEVLDEHAPNDGWLNAKRDLYAKAMFPEVRQAWQDQMDLLIGSIRQTSEPVERKISLVQAN
ncbi:MAG: hypothetical protein ACRDE7_05205, partial [Sphingobacterium sp.]